MDIKSSRKFVKILNVKIDSSSSRSLLRQVQSKLNRKKKFFIVTPNPEQIVMAQKDPLYLEILNSADFSLPDGVGLVAYCKFFSLPRPKSFLKRALVLLAQGLGVGFSIIFNRGFLEEGLKQIKGRQFFMELIRLANKKGLKVVLVGNEKRSAQKAANALKKVFLRLKITGIRGPDLRNDGRVKGKDDEKLEQEAIRKINEIKPDLLFIGFRAPVQEKWLYRLYNELDFVGGMVVGGTFDYLSGTKPLPPKWVEDLNLEWLWRLVRGDQKIKRVFKAFPEFAWRAYWEKLVHNVN